MTVVVTGIGFHGALASDARDFCHALRSGRTAFAWTRLPRSGRVVPAARYQGSEPGSDDRQRRTLRGRPRALQATCSAALEALAQARWRDADCAVIAAGSNIHQAYIAEAYEKFLEKPEYVNPRFAASFLDTTIVAAVSELAGLRGIGFTAGGGMASGNVALFQGWTLVRSGAARACLCIGAMHELSELELIAFANLGALALPEPDGDAAAASRPFDERSTGFVYGEAAAAVLLESSESAASRGAAALAELAGAAIVLDGDSGTEPRADGEAAAMRAALAAAGLDPREIDYVSTHGTGTPAGDRVECAAIREAVGEHPLLNATKALTGHTIGAAGVVELVATIIQMRDAFAHGNPRLERAVDAAMRFAGTSAQNFEMRAALSNSFSIGGINTSVAVRRV